MAYDKDIETALREGIKHIETLKDALVKANSDLDFASVRRKTTTETLIHACDFLAVNLERLADSYRTHITS